MNTASSARFASDWITAWNNHNLVTILSHYEEDINFSSPFITKLNISNDGVIRDKKTLQQYFEIALAKYPDLRFELIQCLHGTSSVVIYYKSINQLFSAEFMEFNAQGKVIRVVAHYSAD